MLVKPKYMEYKYGSDIFFSLSIYHSHKVKIFVIKGMRQWYLVKNKSNALKKSSYLFWISTKNYYQLLPVKS